MKRRIGILVPSRTAVGGDRPGNVQRLIKSWKKTTEGHSTIILGLDFDDEHNYRINHNEIELMLLKQMKLCPKLNEMSLPKVYQYDVIGFVGDDVVFRTPGWEDKILDYIDSNKGTGIVYGNDLIQGENLPTAVFISSNIIEELGFMVPTGIKHMYCDNFWRDLGRGAGCLKYYPDMILEHIHPAVGKSDKDDSYKETEGYLGEDGRVYTKYYNERLQLDIEKIKKLC